MQKEITEALPILDDEGLLIQKGYCRKLLPVYNKQHDLLSRLKTKEWDYYYIGNDHYGIALTIDDNGYMAQDTISFFDFDKAVHITNSKMQLMTLGNKNLPASSVSGTTEYFAKDYHMSFKAEEDKRILIADMENFSEGQNFHADITLTEIPDESMVIVTPFNRKKHFYFNQKINCMAASGTVKIGSNIYSFQPQDSSAVLDWGRGIWTYSNTWYWGSLSTVIDGHRFGFNIGYGFGDTSAASENMLFYDGKAHKLDQVTFHIPGSNTKPNFTDTWLFSSNDNRLNLRMEPIFDRASHVNVLLIESDQHQVFGRFYGTCILDDGTEIKLDGAVGFAEKVKNRW
ncbi:MAG: DUF2804 domain-containing protein [Erysipelotrichaceae bacterium]|nr:DUF2804 domain-containing protein [Erysipelotrichaceae bacterium]